MRILRWELLIWFLNLKLICPYTWSGKPDVQASGLKSQMIASLVLVDNLFKSVFLKTSIFRICFSTYVELSSYNKKVGGYGPLLRIRDPHPLISPVVVIDLLHSLNIVKYKNDLINCEKKFEWFCCSWSKVHSESVHITLRMKMV